MATKIFGRESKSQETALEEALGLWLAWRGDSTYFVAVVGKRPEREASWRVVKYTQIPNLATKYDQVEARSLEGHFPDRVIAFFARYIMAEVERNPGSEVFSESPEGLEGTRQRISADQSFVRMKEGMSVSVRWPSKSAPGLASRTITLAKDSVQCLAYPLLDGARKRRGTGAGFLKLLEKSERRKKQRWIVAHG